MKQDIRWEQRFSNFSKALAQLQKFIAKGKLNELEQQGLIQAFEYTYELAWGVLKDYLQYSGNAALITGSRDAIREAFKVGLIDKGEMWMNMYEDRNRTSHTYNEAVANEIGQAIIQRYYDLFCGLKTQMQKLHS